MPEKNVIEHTTTPMTDMSSAEQLPRIESISDHLDLVPTIASWQWMEWGHVDPKGTLESWTEGLRQRTKRNAIPTTYVAFSERNEPIGSVVLVENDMSTHPELTPWLAGLFVLAPHRNQGRGTALTKHAMNKAMSFGVAKLFLHTSTAASLYRRLGWRMIFQEFYDGEWVEFMEYNSA